MAKDNAESKEIPENAEKPQQKPPLTQTGTRSMQGLPEWTEKEEELLADVRRQRAKQERELQEDLQRHRLEHLPEELSRRREELKAIVNEESAGEDEAQAE
jgi:dipeptidase